MMAPPFNLSYRSPAFFRSMKRGTGGDLFKKIFGAFFFWKMTGLDN